MDADFISFESMLAARSSAEWAYWQMWISLFSTFATFLAAVVALVTVSSWRKQESLKDKKVFILSVNRFQQTIGLGPHTYLLEDIPTNDESHPFWKLTNTLLTIYENAVTISSKKERKKAEAIYLLLSEIYESLHQGEIDRDAAVKKILEIRTNRFFEKI
ncbi:hypothetical protein OH773_13200 [Buttiauxella sp. WJP83]|uniref:hypothetical protein n=1 Tax=Buttiauxella sp. WJP83 TaxID=2986951 RepID=UPI0022DE7D12|nr:hypothetical protein [Buttiauxella sp. WJP83]WBM69142.1 hypothetical protein OH773_13200 [Buttiauxella sp. WJP83]